jgi:autophagy-related protein 101
MAGLRIDLPCLALEHYQMKEALECVLHTIVFTRALNPVEPEDVSPELFDVRSFYCTAL